MGWTPDFSRRVESRDLVVGVVGLGYVGLPTAVGFLHAGFSVRGVDVNTVLIEALREGRGSGEDAEVERDLPEGESERWKVSTDGMLLSDCDVILITVPTPITTDLKPDLSYVESAGRTVFDAIPRGKRRIVLLESTVYPGVTRQVLDPLIAERGLQQGIDVELAYCPERFNPGDPDHGVRQVARVVGASDPEVGASLVPFYGALTEAEVRFVGPMEVAEAAKVIENVQRDLNIALVNELAMVFSRLGLDLEAVLDAASTKWNFHRYKPGLGVGGHCIPVDPYYLMQRAFEVGVPTELIGAARAVNRSMPQHAAKAVNELLEGRGVAAEGARVLFLGWSYKPNVGDLRETPAEPMAAALAEMGMEVAVWEPHLRAEQIEKKGVHFVDRPDAAAPFDCVVLVTAHRVVLDLDWARLLKSARTPLVFDGRRVLDLERLSGLGWDVHAIGRPLA